jgi:hypothetical protein
MLLSVAFLVLGAIALVLLIPQGSDTAAPEPVKRIAPIKSISDLPGRYDDIRALAWQQSMDAINREYVSKMEIESRVSPNSQDCSVEIEKVIRRVERMFSAAILPKKVYLLIGNSLKDQAWLEEQTRSLLTEKYISYSDGKMFNPETSNDEGIGVNWVTDACNARPIPDIEKGVEAAHGFFHVLQTMQFTESDKYWGRWGEVPRWILEGGATFVPTVWKEGESQENYLKKPNDVYSVYQLGEELFRDYFKFTPPRQRGTNEVWAYTDQWPEFHAYLVGSYMCEVLVALRGPESLLNLYREYLKSDSFDVAFEKIYGMTWTKAYPYLTDAVYGSITSTVKFVMPWAIKAS